MTHPGDMMSIAEQDRSEKTNNMTACSTVPNIHLTMRQLQEKLFLLQKERRNLKRHGVALQEKVSEMMMTEAFCVSERSE